MSLTVVSPRKRSWSPTEGRGQVLSPEGDVLWEDPDWVPNALMDEGEENVLNDWLLENAALNKYLCLATAAPSETDDMSWLAVNEVFNPPLNGYARQQIAAGDWSTPALDSGDMQSAAAEKTFGPATGSDWVAMTNIGLVTALTGQTAGSGKFLLHLALSGSTTIRVGQSFKYTLRTKVQ